MGPGGGIVMSWGVTALLGVVAVGLLYVIIPGMIEPVVRFWKRRTIRCPETGEEVSVQVDTKLAALTSLGGRPELSVKDCSRWPEGHECDQECLEREPGYGAQPEGWRAPASPKAL
jgi:hypothetical protein